MIVRFQHDAIRDKLRQSRLLIVNGPRKVGKLDLIKMILLEEQMSYTLLDCSDKKVRQRIESGELALNDNPYVVMDEAQQLSNLQNIIEQVLSDQITSTLVLSCSFPANIDEDLRFVLQNEGFEITVYAPSFYEAAQHFGLPEEEKLLEERLIFGNYPSVLNNLSHAEVTLREIIQDAIFTQMSAHERVNKEDKLMRMLQILAFEIGEAITYNEIGERCGLDNETVERYVDLLTKAHILIKLPSFYSDGRYELKKAHCVYFADNGIRNVLILNFNPTHLRNDMPQLWKNYMVSERVKWIKMNNLNKEVYFWKTHTRQQMDFLEVGENNTQGYKCDWERRNKVKIPPSFTEQYPLAKTSLLNRLTYWSFLTKKN